MQIFYLKFVLADFNEVQNEVFPGYHATNCDEWKFLSILFLNLCYKHLISVKKGFVTLDFRSFQVTCRFNPDFGITILQHDSPDFDITLTPGQSEGCFEPGCYQQVIHYSKTMPLVTMYQISVVIDISLLLVILRSPYNALKERIYHYLFYYKGYSVVGRSCRF